MERVYPVKCPICGLDDKTIKFSSKFRKTSNVVTVLSKYKQEIVSLSDNNWSCCNKQWSCSYSESTEFHPWRKYGEAAILVTDLDDLDEGVFHMVFSLIIGVIGYPLIWLIGTAVISFCLFVPLMITTLVPIVGKIVNEKEKFVLGIIVLLASVVAGIGIIYVDMDSRATKQKIRERIYYCERCAIAFDKITKKIYKPSKYVDWKF